MTITNITRENLSRYIKKFKDKGIFIVNNNTTTINRVLTPEVIGNKTIQIVMILKLKDYDNI